MAEDLFWSVLEHLRATMPSFGGKKYRGFPRRFKRMIHWVILDHEKLFKAVMTAESPLVDGAEQCAYDSRKCPAVVASGPIWEISAEDG